VNYVHEAAAQTDDGTQFYATIDEEKYIAYFEPMRKAHYRYVLRKLDSTPGTSLLDVGASYGWMVEVALELGFDAYGIEPGAVEAEPSLRSRIQRTTLDDYSAGGKQFDVVTIWHALEHFREPSGALNSIRTILKDSGVLVIAVPNAAGRLYWAADMLARTGYKQLLNELYYFHSASMQHYYYLNPQSLKLLLDGSGFSCDSVFAMESLDWTTIYKRTNRTLTRVALKALGPLIAATRFTATENLVVIARPR